MKKIKYLAFVLLVLCLSNYHTVLAQELLPWTVAGTLPPNVSGRHMIAIGDYWYAMEGDNENQGYVGTLYTQFQAGGSFGPWVSTSPRTIDRFGYRAVSNGEYIYLIGGQTEPNVCTNIVEYAVISPNGSLTTWVQTSSFSTPRMAPAVAISGNYIYVIGGHDNAGNPYNTVQHAEILSDGSLSNWNAIPSPTQTARPYSAAVARNGFIYVFGGAVNSFNTNTVERAEINPITGLLDSWTYDKALIEPRGDSGIAVLGGSIYLIGGNAGASSTQGYSSVEHSTFQPDNSLSWWQFSPSSLNNEAWHGHADVWNGYIYATANGLIEMTTQISNTGTLQLLAPNGGEELIADRTETISWTSTGGIVNVLLEYSINNGLDWNIIDVSTPNNGLYEWTIPQVTSEQCLVRISNTSFQTVNDTSDAVFTVFVCQLDSVADLDGNCKVDLSDLALIAADWLRNGNPFDEGFTELSGR